MDPEVKGTEIGNGQTEDQELIAYRKKWGLPDQANADQPIRDLANENHDGPELTREEMKGVMESEIEKVNESIAENAMAKQINPEEVALIDKIVEEGEEGGPKGPGVRWMLQVSLPDVGRRCRFPFSTKHKAFRVASCFKKKHAEVLRLDRWPSREMLEKWKPYIDLNFEQIVENLEGIRNAAKESGETTPERA